METYRIVQLSWVGLYDLPNRLENNVVRLLLAPDLDDLFSMVMRPKLMVCPSFEDLKSLFKPLTLTWLSQSFFDELDAGLLALQAEVERLWIRLRLVDLFRESR